MTHRTATLPASARETRATAAALLWNARTEPASPALDHVLWALCLVPDCRAARMLRVDLLIRSGDYEEARDALAAEALRRPLAWSIAYRRARIAFHRDALSEARAAIRFVLRDRPRHAGALCLAAQIAREQGDIANAHALMTRARAAWPRDRHATMQLIDFALEAGQIDHAASALRSLDAPPAALVARVLAATGRRIDARTHLENALHDADITAADQDSVLCALVELIDADGGVLAPLRWSIRRAHLRATLAYAAAQLSRGRARSALRLARWSARHGGHRLEAMTLIAASASVLGHTNLAASAAGSVHSLVRTPRQRQCAAALWRRAVAGQAIGDIREARTDGPPAGLLPALIERSIEVIQARLASRDSLHADERSGYQRHIRFGMEALEAWQIPPADARPLRRAA